MKIFSLIIAILLTIGMTLETDPAIAQNRVKIFEMAESGQTVEFPMSPDEIAAEDADNARLATLRKSGLDKANKPVTSFELAESGIVIKFPVKPPETIANNQHR
ncbi:hypothetical protein D1BOALGB6SA_1375 [Olavius sp. associated proteobacterium Delta 1]|nr:hypothetical protein D1BOALGB6SA_1375 [Olavius sp. associated proteobacterium Delta 1]